MSNIPQTRRAFQAQATPNRAVPDSTSHPCPVQAVQTLPHQVQALPRQAVQVPSPLEPGRLDVLAASRQATAFAFALLGGCGLRGRQIRVQRMVVARKVARALDPEMGMPGHGNLEDSPRDSVEDTQIAQSAFRIPAHEDRAAITEPPRTSPESLIGGDAMTTSTSEDAQAEVAEDTVEVHDAVAAEPQPEPQPVPPPHVPNPELRTALILKVQSLTFARVSRLLSAPVFAVAPAPAPCDDPFADTCAPALPKPPVPVKPPTLRYGASLQFRPDQDSPTPQARITRRSQTTKFPLRFDAKPAAPREPRPIPGVWAPHPAGSRSCAIAIKAPPSNHKLKAAAASDKENRAVV